MDEVRFNKTNQVVQENNYHSKTYLNTKAQLVCEVDR